MKYISLNTHSWMEENPLQKLKETAEFIMANDVEMIALQEVNQKIEASIFDESATFCSLYEQVPIKEDNYARLLVAYLEEKGFTYYWGWTCSHIGYDIYEEGSAILSKYPFKAESLLVSPTNDMTDYHTRQILLAHFEEFETPLTIASCHFSWWSDNQEEGFYYEWQQLLERIKEEKGQVMLFGDFNAPSHLKNEGYDLVKETMTDMFEIADKKQGSYTVDQTIDGWSDNTEKLRIDFGFVLKPVDVLSYQVIFNDITGPIVSDHLGIMIETAS
ncbi:endonuclease/exonuclease/phosphatase family protein [Vagococcus carniphilus]|uniref:endonuclease/exonuclease/phosphatase family protein n=1 Tax=Vagococcus carniphilus TaxID=218144 RepID=UPI00288E719F|nr:endonuclease/exonuclease/phosphatase family protein [Vagococcus carniphilus]MDT2815779.1 endonuclease/exonuclease/phosphatase family protein [Vagococcus carniphilus]MDT2866226.1 endonuclease/exonuclease/phosphatase family protein [Vagococcus carniphilus]